MDLDRPASVIVLATLLEQEGHVFTRQGTFYKGDFAVDPSYAPAVVVETCHRSAERSLCAPRNPVRRA